MGGFVKAVGGGAGYGGGCSLGWWRVVRREVLEMMENKDTTKKTARWTGLEKRLEEVLDTEAAAILGSVDTR